MPLPDGVKPLTVSMFTAAIKGRLEEHFPNVWVAGEITNLVRAASGHLYFSLKEGKAVLRCAMFRGMALRLKFDLKDGMEVFARGGLSVYEPRGDYQLQVLELQPRGVGSAELALQQLRQKLLSKGYFDPKRKRSLPAYPRRLALIASPTGAAVRDMLEIIVKRWPFAEAIFRPSRVQGEGAAAEVASAVQLLNQLHRSRRLPLDAIVIGRGGGSTEDLAAFNEEVVADAIFQSTVPVVSAVGHEIDVSIADLVADFRALTPSDAINSLCPDRAQLMDELLAFHDRLREAVSHRVELLGQKLDRFADRPAFRRPFHRIHELEQRLDDSSERLTRVGTASLRRSQDRLAALADQLESLSPLNVLKRGYSLTHTTEGRLVRRRADVQPGDRLVSRVSDGEIISRVE